MREIKFRIYQKNQLVGYERLRDDNWEWMSFDTNGEGRENWYRGVFPYNEGPKFKYQRDRFTGLKDKNGKDIYANDLLEFDSDEWGDSSNNIFQVQWDDANGMWDTGGGTNGECKSFKTIIGNIYENPNLLK